MWMKTFVWKRGLSPKLQKSYECPYTIIEKISYVTYHICLSPQARPKIRHYNLLYPYRRENPPTWFQATEPVRQEE